MKPEVTRVSVEIGGTEISFETGKLAKQASGSVVVQAGDTMVLGTATAGNLRDVDFLPLTVDVEERMYAAGKIPGSFFKREGRAGEKGTLTARMIDRPIRPLFPKGWRRETQLVSIPMSIDHVHPYDILAMNGASAALMVSDIPFPQPVGAVRIGQDDEGNFVVNPDEEDNLDANLDLVVSGTEEAILMVEAGAQEISEAAILDALDIAHGEIKKLCAAQRELAEKAGKPKVEVEVPQVDESVFAQVKAEFETALTTATQVEDKLERQDDTKAVEENALKSLSGDEDADDYKAKRAAVQMAFDKLEKDLIRKRIAVDKVRPDGRAADQVRDIWIEVGVGPKTHGSAVFTRGQTQAFSVATLGTTRDEMRLDTLGLETTRRYWHHYNFPPFSVGEAGFMRGPKRRDIGHGALAERALVPVIPSAEEFPYSIRVVSDILESNGSSSMASVCGSSLSLMDAGVQIKAPVAGIAMGLIKEGDDYIVLSDIAGVEDHLGDMDFKVAGTSEGITALQMDIKITGVTFEILTDALTQAKAGRTEILGKMAEAIEGPRPELSKNAPSIGQIQIDTDKIGMIIGKGGETIRALSEEFEAQIDIDDDGTIRVFAINGEQGDALVERIQSMTKEIEVGDEFDGKVVKTTTFGAFVELSKGNDGLLHISNVKPGERVDAVEDVLNRGDEIAVRVVEVDKERGRVGLRLADDPDIAGKTSEELASVGTGDKRGGGGGGGRDRDRGGRGGRDRGGRERQRRRPQPRPALNDAAEITTLDSGVRVVSERIDSVRSTALGIWMRTGSRDEAPEQAGLSHFLEHLLFKGTDRFSSLEIDETFDAMGAEVNAGTSKETTTVYSRFLDRHLDRAFDVMSDMVLRPTYPDIDSERQVVIEEIAMYEDEPSDKVHDVLADAVFGDHPLGRPVIGRAEVIAGVPVPDIAAYRDRALRVVEPGGGRAPGASSTTACVELVRGRAGRPRGRGRAGAGQRRRAPEPSRGCASTPRRPSSTTSRWAPRASPAVTSAGSRCGCSTRSWAAPARRGCSRRCARSAAWPTPSTRSPASSSTPARSACTWARGPTTSTRPWR